MLQREGGRGCLNIITSCLFFRQMDNKELNYVGIFYGIPVYGNDFGKSNSFDEIIEQK
jgi:hypothetical protein